MDMIERLEKLNYRIKKAEERLRLQKEGAKEREAFKNLLETLQEKKRKLLENAPPEVVSQFKSNQKRSEQRQQSKASTSSYGYTSTRTKRSTTDHAKHTSSIPDDDGEPYPNAHKTEQAEYEAYWREQQTSQANYKQDRTQYGEKKEYENLDFIFLIFGNSFIEKIGHHSFKIEFLKEQIEKASNQQKVYCNIYEDGQYVIKKAFIRFRYKEKGNHKVLNDVSFSIEQDTPNNKQQFKYFDHTQWFSKIAYSLLRKWNEYFFPKSRNHAMPGDDPQDDMSYSNKSHIMTIIENCDQRSKFDNIPIPLFERKMTLVFDHPVSNLYEALDQGVAYTIKNNAVYIWYQQSHILDAAYLRFERYEISGNKVTFTLSISDRICL